MSAAVVAILADKEPQRDLAAGFEEEGVPFSVTSGPGQALELARTAANRSPLGIGIGGDTERLVAVLAAAPSRAYLSGRVSAARPFGQAAARIAARRPVAWPP